MGYQSATDITVLGAIIYHTGDIPVRGDKFVTKQPVARLS